MVPVLRRAARLLIIDPDDRILLLHGFDPAVPEVRYWFTVGGGLEPGETPAEAAVREAAEEVGLRLRVAEIGPPLWSDTADFSFDGTAIRNVQDFFVVRVAAFEPMRGGMDALELASIIGSRWWPLAELAAHQQDPAATELVYPLDLADRLSATGRTVFAAGAEQGKDATVQIEAVSGDITVQYVDVVVNAANSALLGGGGVDAAIHRAAGPDLLAECQKLRDTVLPDGLPVGDAVATGAGNMRAKWIVHTVGPNWHAGEHDPALLASCFTRSLEVAGELGATSIAFPAISAGAYGWDVELVARTAIEAVRAAPESSVQLVRFVLFSMRARKALQSILR